MWSVTSFAVKGLPDQCKRVELASTKGSTMQTTAATKEPVVVML